MGLESCKIEAIVAVSMDKAQDFYEGMLRLPGGPEEGDGGITPDASSPIVKGDRFPPAVASA